MRPLITHTTSLSNFFNRIVQDHRILPSHISIYVLLCHYSASKKYQNPIHITRSDVMKKTKIHSSATYHKCIKELHNYGYIHYNPSYHPVLGSEVYLNNLEQPSHDTETEPR